MSLPPYPHYDKLYSRFVRPSRKRLSYEQTAEILHKAGFRGEALVTAVAVSRPESAGDPQAYLAYVDLPKWPRAIKYKYAHARLSARRRLTYWRWGPSVITFRHLAKRLGAELVDVDIGLMQIKWWWLQESYGMADLCDPHISAELAFGKWRASGFRPWAAYNAGLHLKFMDEARRACRARGYI